MEIREALTLTTCFWCCGIERAAVGCRHLDLRHEGDLDEHPALVERDGHGDGRPDGDCHGAGGGIGVIQGRNLDPEAQAREVRAG